MISDIDKIFDSSKMVRIDYREDEMKEVSDKVNIFGQRGIYKFDNSNVLKFYAFLLNEGNEYDFSIQYDSLGNETSNTGTEVVYWYFRKLRGDTLAVTFLLYTVNRSYRDLHIEYGMKRFDNLQLQKSKTFSNLIGSTIDVEIPDNSKDTVYIYGIREDACLRQSQTFKDFVLVPKEVL